MATYKNPYAVAKPLDPMFTVGRVLRTVQAQIAIGAESANNDVIILAKGVPPTARVARIMLPAGSSALTGCTVDIGLYKMQKNISAEEATDLATEYVAVDEDCLVDGQSFATAMNNVDIVGANIASFDRTADLATLVKASAGEFPSGGYAIGAKLVAKGSVNGNIELDILIEQA